MCNSELEDYLLKLFDVCVDYLTFEQICSLVQDEFLTSCSVDDVVPALESLCNNGLVVPFNRLLLLPARFDLSCGFKRSVRAARLCCFNLGG